MFRYLRRAFFWMLLHVMAVWDIYKRVVVTTPKVPASKHYHRIRLEALLRKVNCDIPYHKGRYTEFLETTKMVSDAEFLEAFSRLPTMSKEDLFRSESPVHGQEMPTLDFSHGLWSLVNQVRGGSFTYKLATGGSSKLPLKVSMNKEHAMRMLFSFVACWYRMGWRPGYQMLVWYPNGIYDLRGFEGLNGWSWLTGVRFLLFDNLSEGSVQNLVGELNTHRPELLVAFPSSLNAAAYAIRRDKLELKHSPKWVNLSGETLFQCHRNSIERTFKGSRVEDSYGSVELGEIAHEVYPGILEILEHHAYVEALPVGGKTELVATIHEGGDYFPFIRYRMGDLVERLFVPGHLFAIEKVNGKSSNQVRLPGGHTLYPLDIEAMTSDLEKRFPGALVDIKFIIHTTKAIEVQVVLENRNYGLAIAEVLKEGIAKLAVGPVTVAVRFVDQFDHDYRRKHRVIEDKSQEIEYAGGVI